MVRKRAATYFIGYPVEKVVSHKDGFEIHFIHGSIVSHEAGLVPTWAKGSTLNDVHYSEDESATTLVFAGGSTVVLDAKSYSVTHPSTGTIYPERDEEQSSLPPDPSDERVADGPELAR